jgi:ubiquinone/menaquinone biosynthesis C-methylase UbiE
MSLSGRIFAANYDRFMSKTERAGLAAQRAALLRSASGEVIEIGGGTGASLPGYDLAGTSLTITEPEAPMVRRLVQRARAQAPAARVLRAPAEDLPFDDAQFDVAVSALVLCTVADQPRALRELHRVLRPGGRLLFIEHVRSDEPGLSRWQDRLNWLNQIIAHGCNCNRPTLDTIRAAGFSIAGLERSELRDAPPFVRPLVIGTATAAGPAHPGAATAATRSA